MENQASEDLLEAAACLWEAFLETPEEFPNLCEIQEKDGTAFCRLFVVGLAEQCSTDWEKETAFFDCFDWDFVPHWLKEKDKTLY